MSGKWHLTPAQSSVGIIRFAKDTSLHRQDKASNKILDFLKKLEYENPEVIELTWSRETESNHGEEDHS